jgi:undecaprenyl diphosphate synthase
MSYKEQIKQDRIPRHIAIIMDGNGRWAKKQGLARMFGHKQGVETVHRITEAAAELGIQYLTLYAFSTENWNRRKEEVDALMALLVYTIVKETPTVIFRSHIQVFVVPGSTLFMHHNIFSLAFIHQILAQIYTII